jgi:putative copper resistance protein D
MPGLLGVLHAVDYIATSMLLGYVAFHAWIAPKKEQSPAGLVPTDWRTIGLCALVLTASSIWFLVTAVDMSDSSSFSSFLTVLTQTRFGHAFALKCLVIWTLSLTFLIKRLHNFYPVVFLLPAIATMTSHTGAHADGLTWTVVVDFLHFSAVSLWTGGLFGLLFYLKSRQWPMRTPEVTSIETVRRFSHLAMASTATVAVTGGILSYRYSFSNGWAALESPYGQLVALKIVLFCCALLAASINQFVHIRVWSPAKDRAFTSAVIREASIELTLAIFVFVAAGYLTRVSPPIP